MKTFELSRDFPREETYSLTGQIRNASWSVCSNTSEGWHKGGHVAAFQSKLNDAEGEAAETQTWLRFAAACGYLEHEAARRQNRTYDRIIRKLAKMIVDPAPWILPIRDR